MKVNLGGVVPLSTVDWFGLAAIVIFFRGCPLRCPYCQNRDLQTGESFEQLSNVMEKIRQAAPFVSAVVFSGGEPLKQIRPLIELSKFAGALGLKVGLETCGYFPEKLSNLIEEGVIDKVFLDVKAALKDPEYARAVGKKNVALRVKESLRKCIQQGIPIEVRTTIFPDMPHMEELVEIAEMLSISGLTSGVPMTNNAETVETLVLQQGIPRDEEFEPVSKERLEFLARSIEHLIEVKVRGNPDVSTLGKSANDNHFTGGT